ncbi:MAG: Ig-like domain-containing protein [Gammaproteobacteria bacterium]|nr:Ig-like domain-containing protein [Gammaproteobacteria bacterium]
MNVLYRICACAYLLGLTACSGDSRPFEEAVEASELNLVSLSITTPPFVVEPLFVSAGAQVQFGLSGTNEAGGSVTVTNENRRWSVSDSSVARISSEGLLVAEAEGEVQVGVRIAGILAPEYSLTVSNANLDGISSIEGEDIVRRCDPSRFAAWGVFDDGSIRAIGNASWSLEPESVGRLEADSDGAIKVIGLDPGTLMLSATVNAFSRSRGIEVDSSLESITIAPVAPTVNIDGTEQLTATGSYVNTSGPASLNITQSVNWRVIVGDEYASIIETGENAGLLTGVSEGSATIQANCGNLLESITAVVSGSASSLSFLQASPFVVSLSVDSERDLNVYTGSSYSTSTDVTDAATWSVTSGSEFVSINDGSNKGRLTALAVGEAQVQAEYNDITAVIDIEVVD